VKQETLREAINYLTLMKNAHESRITCLERIVPDDLDKRLRDVEIKTYIISIIVPMLVTLAMKLLSN